MLQQRQGPQQGTVLNNAAAVNATAFAQKREGIPANQQPLVFKVPAKVEVKVEATVEKAAAAAKAAQAAAEETQELEKELAALKAK